VMIFYHVLAHIDFFQNNLLFKHTWDEDFAGRALSDKRLITKLRSEKGRWVDYVIEFTRGIDNQVGFYGELSDRNHPQETTSLMRLDYYFDIFLQSDKKVKTHEYLKEIDRFNEAVARYGPVAESVFFSDIIKKYPEFDALFDKQKKVKKPVVRDLIQYLLEHSSFLKKEENLWMSAVMQIVRNTSLFFQPQIRTKILNEGWASYWHERLFLTDDRIKGHEVDFARVNAKVTALPRIGLNPYALGMRLFQYIEDMAARGKHAYEFQRIDNIRQRETYHRETEDGTAFSFRVREDFSDFTFINTFTDQDFVDRFKVFVSGKHINREKGVWEYYVKSRDAKEYKQMLIDSLYHPPYIKVDESKMEENGCLYLNHCFEGKPLVREFISNTMIGIEYLWGGPVKLETTGPVEESREKTTYAPYFGAFAVEPERQKKAPEYKRVLYTMEKRKLTRKELE